MYKPILYEYEKPLNKNIILTDLSYISRSLAYTNSNINIQKNVYNILNQCYSRNKPRYIIPDNFLIITTNIYLNWLNLFKNIKNIINNKIIENKLKNINEKLLFNMEELLLSNYLYYDYIITILIKSCCLFKLKIHY